MRILCCIDGTNAEQLSRTVSTLFGNEEKTVGVLYVVDSGPEAHMELGRERHLRSLRPPRPREERMRQAEGQAAQEILEEGSRFLDRAETLKRNGRPEREIVQVAVEWRADLVLVCARAIQGGGPSLGPKSVGHVARFVLDHTPCPVLLVRFSVDRDAV